MAEASATVETSEPAYARWLMARLEQYEPRDEMERRHLVQMRELLALGRAPFSRSAFEPGHFTASGFVLSPERRRLLLIRHKKLGLWLQPGGHIEPSDADAVATARREIEEETLLVDLALLVPGPTRPSATEPELFHLDVHAIPERPNEPRHRHYDLRFAFVAQSLDVSAKSDAAAVNWFSLAELDQLQTDDSVTRAFRHLLEAID